jgi:hypothetical protein
MTDDAREAERRRVAELETLTRELMHAVKMLNQRVTELEGTITGALAQQLLERQMMGMVS